MTTTLSTNRSPTPLSSCSTCLPLQIQAQPWVASLPPGSMPRTESLQDLVARTVPFWKQQVEPRIREG